VRSGRGELLAHDGQSVNVFRLGGSVPIRPQVQVGTGHLTQAAHAPSPVSQSASLNPSLTRQAQQFPAADPAEVRAAEPTPASSLIIIGRKDHSVVQTTQTTPAPASSATPDLSGSATGHEALSYTSGRQASTETTSAFTQGQQTTPRPMRIPNSTSSTPHNPGSPYAVQHSIRTETSGPAGQTPVQPQGRAISIPQEAPAPPPRQFSAPRYDPPPRPIERVEAPPQRAPQPVIVESRPVRSEPAPQPSSPPPSAQAAPTQSSSHR
jgi:hypothetical protein